MSWLIRARLSSHVKKKQHKFHLRHNLADSIQHCTVIALYYRQSLSASILFSVMSRYKLTYFNFRARAESTRIAFAYGGVEYEDIRIEMLPREKEWLPIKKSECCYCETYIWKINYSSLSRFYSYATKAFKNQTPYGWEVRHLTMNVDYGSIWGARAVEESWRST